MPCSLPERHHSTAWRSSPRSRAISPRAANACVSPASSERVNHSWAPARSPARILRYPMLFAATPSPCSAPLVHQCSAVEVSQRRIRTPPRLTMASMLPAPAQGSRIAAATSNRAAAMAARLTSSQSVPSTCAVAALQIMSGSSLTFDCLAVADTK
ncbi:hypothetical protein STAN_3993 [Streptomyces sp. CBMAI 2042]|nr:hypothetical protein STAN_3993 [Streptomyces sp. CBMAI 2042]